MSGPRHAGKEQRRVALAVLLVSALTVGCTSSSEGGAGGSAAPLAGDVVRLLADAGVGVYVDPTSTEAVAPPATPVSPVRLLSAQADALAARVEGGTGYTAAELNDLVPGGRAGGLNVTASRAIDGWAEHAGTRAADIATELLARADEVPDGVPDSEVPRYSELVLLLFASDLATVGSSLGTAAVTPSMSTASPVAYVPATAVDIGAACQQAVAFVGSVQAAVHNALSMLVIDPPPVQTGFPLFDSVANAVVQGITGLANTVVRGAQVFVDGVFHATVGQVMRFVGRIAGVVGTLATVLSHIQPWRVTVTERDPVVNQMGVAPATKGPPGTVTARVHVLVDEWPKDVAQCAEAVNRPLPNLKPEGSKVVWALERSGHHPQSGMVLAVRDGTRTEAQLNSRGTAQFGYHAGVEPKPGENAPEETGVVYASIRIKRDDLTELQKSFHNLVTDAITGALPLDGVPFARTLVEQTARRLLSQVTDGVVKSLEKLRTAPGRGMIVVRYHGEGDETPDPEVTDHPQARVPVTCPGVATIGLGVRFSHSYTHLQAGIPGPAGRGCAYARAGASVVVDIAEARVVETDEPGRLAYALHSRRLDVRLADVERLDLPGTGGAWKGHAPGQPDQLWAIAVVGERTVGVSADGSLADSATVNALLVRVLGLG